MVNILVFGMTENPGGVESFIISYYRRLNGDGLRFDFLCNDSGTIAYQDELTAGGSKIYRVTARSRDYSAFRRDEKAFFSAHAAEYDAIWVNVCSLANIDYLIMAKRYGIRRRIIHSHNASNMDGRLRGLLHALNKSRVERYATDFWACSDSAAKWFYKGRVLDRALIIRNAIDPERYSFSGASRERIRRELGCGADCCLVGCVGRLHFQKNQRFALEVFRCFLNRRPDSKLALVGQGEDEEMLRSRARELGIADRVIFAGVRQDIPAWLSAMDLFLFPSVFEGLGIAALEAQANGLPVLASRDVIPAEVFLSERCQTRGLDEPAEAWAESLTRMVRAMPREPDDGIRRLFLEKGFDIRTEADRLKRLLVE